MVHCACNIVQLLQHYRLPFSWTMHAPNTLERNALITRFRESYSSVIISRESKILKKSSSWLNSRNVLILHQGKMQFPRFSVLPGSAEAQVNWCGIVKCLLIAYFIGNISAKKYQTPFTCVRVIASQRWDMFFWDTVHFILTSLVRRAFTTRNETFCLLCSRA